MNMRMMEEILSLVGETMLEIDAMMMSAKMSTGANSIGIMSKTKGVLSRVTAMTKGNLSPVATTPHTHTS